MDQVSSSWRIILDHRGHRLFHLLLPWSRSGPLGSEGSSTNPLKLGPPISWVLSEDWNCRSTTTRIIYDHQDQHQQTFWTCPIVPVEDRSADQHSKLKDCVFSLCGSWNTSTPPVSVYVQDYPACISAGYCCDPGVFASISLSMFGHISQISLVLMFKLDLSGATSAWRSLAAANTTAGSFVSEQATAKTLQLTYWNA